MSTKDLHPGLGSGALREALEQIRKTPKMPFPDAGAHSWQAYADALSRAYNRIQAIAAEALSLSSPIEPPSREPKNARELAEKLCDCAAREIRAAKGGEVVSEQASHHWWMFLSHDWKVTGVRTRFEPFRDPETLVIHENVGSRKTDILYRCACGNVKVKTVRGEWDLAAVRP